MYVPSLIECHKTMRSNDRCILCGYHGQVTITLWYLIMANYMLYSITNFISNLLNYTKL